MSHRCSAVVLALALLLTSCSERPRYHYAIFVFRESPIGGYTPTPVRSGEGDPINCGFLFGFGTGLYIGNVIQIPPDSVVFGVLSATDGKTTAVIPLYSWVDEHGVNQFGCNGPKPRFAQHRRTREELIDAVVAVVAMKEQAE